MKNLLHFHTMGQSRNTSEEEFTYRLFVGEKGRFVNEGFAEFLSLTQNGITCLERDNVITHSRKKYRSPQRVALAWRAILWSIP
jgi:hypothetical protein